jgi:hypothetical protein
MGRPPETAQKDAILCGQLMERGRKAQKFVRFIEVQFVQDIVESAQREPTQVWVLNRFARTLSCGASMISTCQEKKHFSLHSPEGFEARGYS